MSYTTHSPVRGGTSTNFGELAASIFASAVSEVTARIREYRTRRALMELNDFMLKDIGLSRSDIDAVACEVSRK